MNIFEIVSSYPLIKKMTIPKVSMRINPSDMKSYKNENRQINTENLNIDRLGLVIHLSQDKT